MEELKTEPIPGLMKTYIVHRDSQKVVVNEEWDLSVPGCPMIRLPWMPDLLQGEDHIIRQQALTPEEFEAHFGREKDDER